MRVLKSGKRVSDSQLSFAILANDQGHARLGLAIAKRGVPHAVDRNAIKRQVREAFRLHSDLPAVDIVALTRRSTQVDDLKKIRNSADTLFGRIIQHQRRVST
ncbi:MAG: ribonuclease P protein component [Gammaproteobacteria bacterium]|nr:ribonuclease P protein component [Gammaproteobacteria bacterium]NNM13456.1 ribonuclease P protein component [Gammaproteobacteria bacterium]